SERYSDRFDGEPGDGRTAGEPVREYHARIHGNAPRRRGRDSGRRREGHEGSGGKERRIAGQPHRIVVRRAGSHQRSPARQGFAGQALDGRASLQPPEEPPGKGRRDHYECSGGTGNAGKTEHLRRDVNEGGQSPETRTGEIRTYLPGK